MTFPVVEAKSSNGTAAAATSHTVTLPATINTGDLLVILFAARGTPTITWDNSTAGTWTQLSAVTGTGSASQNEIRYKVASGSEDGAALSIGTSTSCQSAYICYRISGHGSAIESGTPVYNTSGASPDTPSLTPSWGALDTLWLSLLSINNTPTVSAYPTSYTDGTRVPSSGGTNIEVAGCYRTNNTTSEDPAAYTISAAQTAVGWTIGIKPSASGFSITSVTPSSFDDGHTGIVIAGSGFGASQGSSTVTIGNSTQTVTAWSETSITFTAVAPTSGGNKSYGANSVKVTVV